MFWAKGDLSETYMISLVGFARFIVFADEHDPDWNPNESEGS